MPGDRGDEKGAVEERINRQGEVLVMGKPRRSARALGSGALAAEGTSFGVGMPDAKELGS